MKILIAVDGSDYTKHMLEYVAAEKTWLAAHSEVTVLTVVPELPPHVRAYMNAADVRSYCEQEAATVLKPVRQFVWPEGWQPKIAYKVGSPGSVIAGTAAAEGFDLIVMGSHGKTKLTTMVLGSVTAEVLARCRVPVLILRPDAHER